MTLYNLPFLKPKVKCDNMTEINILQNREKGKNKILFVTGNEKIKHEFNLST